jgi:methionyl-tRNA formyltransferase
LAGDFPRRKQDESQVTYARKLTKEDGRVDWTRPAVEIERQVRAFNPWPGAFAFLGDMMLKLWKVEVTAPGTLRVSEVQPANGKRMSFDAFKRGHPDALAQGWR